MCFLLGKPVQNILSGTFLLAETASVLEDLFAYSCLSNLGFGLQLQIRIHWNLLGCISFYCYCHYVTWNFSTEE